MNIQPASQQINTLIGSAPATARSLVENQPANVKGTSLFQEVLSHVVETANNEQLTADQAIEDFSTGKTSDVHSVVMATVKADLSFRFLVELRNKLTESYQELSRMQF